MIESAELKRFVLQTGDPITAIRGSEGGWNESPQVVGSDANYDNRAYWRVLYVDSEVFPTYLIKSIATWRYLFQTGEVIGNEQGDEGGWINSPNVVGSDANYHNRAYWKIIPQGNETYIIENVVTHRYLFQTGDPLDGEREYEGNWMHSPSIVGSDANYGNRAFFKLLKQERVACDQDDSCGKYAACTNTEGSSVCLCESGFAGDGIDCDGKS